MNENKIKGGLKQAEGKIQSEWGELTNDPVDVAEGEAKQVAGKTRKEVGKLQDKI